MNEIEKQILSNQWAIMKSLFNQDSESDEELIKQLDNTDDLLNPPKEQSIKDKTEDAFGSSKE